MSKKEVLCPLCGAPVERGAFQAHFEIEKYVLDRISRDHPEWKESDGSCTKCIQHYLKLSGD